MSPAAVLHRPDGSHGPVRCGICGNAASNREYEVQEMMFGYRDVFAYFQCSVCGCLQIKFPPSDLSKYYPDDYYSYQPVSESNKLRRFLAALRNRYAVFDRGRLGRLMYVRKPNPALRALAPLRLDKAARVLDVGCGSGGFLYCLRSLGFDNLLGIDPYNERDITYRNGLRIEKKSIHEVVGQRDVITFHHAFEHVPDPQMTLRCAARLLGPGGWCVIRTPTVSSYAWRHYGVKWVQIDAPRHLFVQSVDSMRILSSGAGFELHDVAYDSTSFQFWGSEQYVMDIPLRDPCSHGRNPKGSIFSKRQLAEFARRAEELNAAKQGDQAIFYLRRV